MLRDRVIEFRRVRAGDLVPHPDNWREHPAEQREAYAAILGEIGFAGAILTRLMDDGRLQIIDGHMRSNYSPDEELPVVVTDLTAAEADKALVTFDPLASMARANADKLAALHGRIAFEHDELRERMQAYAQEHGAQFEEEEPTPDPGAQVDRAAELQEKWQTERGQLWQVGRHRVMCGDSTDAGDVARLMGGVKAELCLTSPPYNMGENAKTDGYLGNGNTSKYTTMSDDNLTDSEYLDLLCSFTSCALNHSDYVFVNIQSLAKNKLIIIDYLHKFRNHFADVAIWNKVQAQPALAENVMTSAFEYIFIFSTTTKPSRAILTAQFGRGGLRNVYTSPNASQNDFADIHAATYPLFFASHWVENFSNNKGDVYDPFLGSGTTLVACEQTGRVGYGMEIDPGYVAVTLERLTAMGLDAELQS